MAIRPAVGMSASELVSILLPAQVQGAPVVKMAHVGGLASTGQTGHMTPRPFTLPSPTITVWPREPRHATMAKSGTSASLGDPKLTPPASPFLR